jgi:hypothetical protein
VIEKGKRNMDLMSGVLESPQKDKMIENELHTIMVLKEKHEKHILDVFERYIDINNINFSCPEYWEVEEDGILFYGYDYCFGVAENKTLKIPMKSFY